MIRTALFGFAILSISAMPALAGHRHHHKSLDAMHPGNGHSVNGPASNGAGTGENKPSASGGQPGGSTGQQ